MKKNLKRISLLMAILLLSLALLAGCGKGEEKPSDNGEKQPVDEGQTYELKLATVVSAPHPWIDMAEYFKSEVEAKTDGKVKVTVYPSGQLGADETTIDEMRSGTIDFVIGGTQNFASFIPEYQVFGLSYLFDSAEQFEKVLDANSPVSKKFAELYAEKKLGLKLLGLSNGGSRYTFNNLKPIEKPDDLKGLKMRLPGSPMESKLWGAIGAIPTSLPFNEVYSAIQTGVVNAFEATLSGHIGSKTYEVAPYLSKTQHLFMVTHFSMSEKTFDKLPEEYMNIVATAADEAAVLGSKNAMEAEAGLFKKLEEEFDTEINEVDKAAFAEVVAPLYEELAKDVGGEEILRMINEMK